MNAADVLSQHAAMIKRLIAEQEEKFGVERAYPITQHLLAALEEIDRNRRVL